MEAIAQGGDAQQRLRLRRRARVAGAILLIAIASIVFGGARRLYQSKTANFWQARLMRGEPAVARFICGADPALDCKVSVKITYQKQDSKWCENLERSDREEIDKTHWCNGDPERRASTISLFGVPYSFDRFGAVKNEDRAVGQLFER
ncbi:hypothetical protein SAMN05444159_3640 [Bradyrhizobium lablabi]|uniref:Uncharacterized protein n=1 Tax=Bradyrhizobium lablabi TaxID=722472 RepID=A0A1M6TMM3_9BRAD|nr:hypothetical protein [Bradyrhizobium lablabi]SHK58302.1 hypothetical protein SAMN05444159_3640 [Bradyrhizobium lablabi]